MPPCAPPTRTVFPVESLGSTAMASIRPDTGLKKPPVVGAGPRRPRSANGRARLWDHSGEATIRPANELAFGFHHALHVLESLQAGAGGDVPAGIGALLVEPFFALP